MPYPETALEVLPGESAFDPPSDLGESYTDPAPLEKAKLQASHSVEVALVI